MTAEFAEMQHGLAVKRAEITHAEVPAQLLAQPTIQKRQNNGGEKSSGKFESGKKQKLGINKLTAINPILKPIADAWLAQRETEIERHLQLLQDLPKSIDNRHEKMQE